ncbi:hypothetical protein PLESTB_000442100 [Pleodorina starrii]|uniref:Fido domain-containing protein n=1 Tax=Pleodorina starrii TaxID=330485 RepID=A0A9W6EZR2_9CHLO|nr:hypothetical protein PLESTB_000442100 [Pleodorina starrii]GLC73925.1 hypothetical protein PLESTF_001438300 [Pleodorina starrii]
MGNKTEGTLPAGIDQRQMYALVESVFSAQGPVDYTPSPPEPWSAEGGANSGSSSQILQHAKALKYLCFDRALGALDVDAVLRTHKILMWGAEDDNKIKVKAGEYRSTPARSGTGYVYHEPSLIAPGVEKVVSDYNDKLPKVKAGQMDAELLAAQLFYDMVTLHPFENGNGRLCRLLAAFALMSAGDPFPLPLSNGLKEVRSHCQQVLRYADKHLGDVSRLAAHILECRAFSWQNLVANARWEQ